MLNKIKRAVANFAPAIATALGGPLDGIGVKALSSVFLGHEDGTEEQIEAAFQNATPDQFVALRKAEQDFSLEVKRIEQSSELAYLGDIQNARQSFSHDRGVFWLGIFVLTLCFLFCGCTIAFSAYFELPRGYDVLLGTVLTLCAQVITYFFGSSASSQFKNHHLVDALKKNANTTK